jgi:hypothetical protein
MSEANKFSREREREERVEAVSRFIFVRGS